NGAPTRPTWVCGAVLLSLEMITYTRPVSGWLRTEVGIVISNLSCARPEGPGMTTDVWATASGAVHTNKMAASMSVKRDVIGMASARIWRGGKGHPPVTTFQYRRARGTACLPLACLQSQHPTSAAPGESFAHRRDRPCGLGRRPDGIGSWPLPAPPWPPSPGSATQSGIGYS